MNALVTSSPIGPVAVLHGDRGVSAVGFTADPRELVRFLPRERQSERIEPLGNAEVADRLGAYFDGDLAAVGDIPLDVAGSAWCGTVWSRLRGVPAGETRTYSQIAAQCGVRSARAVGAACARNAVSLLVPCHRIVGGDGSLRGYAWGLERKEWLLEHEAAGR